ncbi:MAG: FAD-dependent oxidoreductase [Candidatus Omnitrophica bacterium]|nr:FAD-dependent oxidoreductase [Candidatus Omnitrophota bacterium]
MKKVVIIGGGFAGLSALKVLARSGLGLKVVLIDRKQTFGFLPLLPDCIGRGINPDNLVCKIINICKKFQADFINKEVEAVNLEQKKIYLEAENLSYDYLVISSGSETNFYGNNEIRLCLNALDDAVDAEKIVSALKENNFDNYLVVGGGYTGVEVATNLRIYLDKAKKTGEIIIVERAASILGNLPEWMKIYVLDNLKRLKINAYTGNSLSNVDKYRVRLSDGREFNNCLVVWAAGVKTGSFIQNLAIEKNPQGRIKVDDYLRLNETCFVCGDAANFSFKNNFLRMAVQFSITEGEVAAENIVRSIKGGSLSKFKPVDLGYIVPMANNRSCGEVFGFRVKGVFATLLHFIMCIYRSCSIKNKIGILKNLSKGG